MSVKTKSAYPFPKSYRLLKKRDYIHLFRRKKRLMGPFFSLDYSFKKAPPSKLGLSVSHKYGKAHDRNRFKRLIRETFRLHGQTDHFFTFHVVPTPLAKKASFMEITKQWLDFSKKLEKEALAYKEKINS